MWDAAAPLRLSRRAASEYLRDVHGISRSVSTLAHYAMVGGGPAYSKFGNDVVYARADLDAWVEQNLSTPPLANSKDST